MSNIKGSSIMLNLIEYREWCKTNNSIPMVRSQVNGERIHTAKEGEEENEVQLEQRLGRARNNFFKKIKDKETLTEEEKLIKKEYEELEKQYKGSISKSERRSRTLFLEQKISLFQDYIADNPEEPIIISTIYKGYPIGQMLISLRSQIKTKPQSVSQEHYEILKEMGLLENRHESTIEEKIDRLEEFCKSNPELWYISSYEQNIESFINDNISDREKEELLKKLDIVKKDYAYIRYRMSRRKKTR